ncbi:Flap endonuclease 1 [Capsicum baccatum]|uniref:Flap endonuclease 1 n=1 Tax=Capsicum baccatum TaxID=33114 RepID=A0A2G2W895_CAPBA|nr:Flap endonuclease 1 [Capsicum baccatum]
MKLLADNAPSGMKEQKFESYFGRKIAIDASMSIYQFLIVVGRSGTEMLTNEAGETTSHLVGMFSRTIRLLEAGIKPVYVFDGKPPDLKKQELAKRYSRREDATDDLAKATETGNKEDIEKFSKRTVKVTPQHNEDCKKLLRLMGVPAVEAPSEAEAQCAVLCKAEKVYAVASEDMDSLTFGAPKFLRHLMDPSSKKIPVMEFDISKVLEELELSMDQFIDLCILCGCDYCDSIRGIGPQTALKLVRQHGSMESILENINKERYQIPDDWPYNEARRLFKEPLVVTDDEQTELKWAAPDEEGLVNFLVKENGFNIDRVTKAIEKIKTAKNKSSQGRLESFFKPVSTSAPVKRKGTKCVLVSLIPVTKFKTLSLRSRPGVPGGLIYPSLGLRSGRPRASEIIYVLEGELLVGFITTDNDLFSKVIKPGEVFVSPRGLVHFQKNTGKSLASIIAAFNSQLPGIQLISPTLFGSSPPVPDDILAQTFLTTTAKIALLRKIFV